MTRVGVRVVLRNREFAAVLVAVTLSVLGDQVARLAVAVLVFSSTGSAFAASATYACSYLTWLVGGPLLSALADRHRRRRLMVVCDLLRAGLIALLVVPGLPLPVLFAVLVVVGLFAPPFDAARSALLPDVLRGDAYVTGSAVLSTVVQAAQVLGFLLGGLLVALSSPQTALIVDAATFLVSALLVVLLVQERPVAPGTGATLLRDARRGVGTVLESRALRRLLAFGLLGAVAVIVPEGLAVPVSEQLGGGPLSAGLLTAAVPAGFVAGSFLVLRVRPERRVELLPTLSLLTAVPLLLSVWADSVASMAALWLLAGSGSAGQLVANTAFMTRAPAHVRGRAYGVAATALMVVQGAALLLAGALAELVDPRTAAAAGAAVALCLLPLVRRPATPLLPARVPAALADAGAVPGSVSGSGSGSGSSSVVPYPEAEAAGQRAGAAPGTTPLGPT